MPVLPSSLSLSGWPVDGSSMVAAPGRTDLASIQTAVNSIISTLGAGASGQFLTGAGTTLTWAGGYTDYNPTWGATGVAPVLGNGTSTGRYVQIGKLVHFYGQLIMGGTTTFGTGTYSISLPVARSATGFASGRVHGVVEGFDSSTSNEMSAVADTTVSVGSFQIAYAATYLGTRTSVAATAPWTWAVGDLINWNIIYEGV